MMVKLSQGVAAGIVLMSIAEMFRPGSFGLVTSQDFVSYVLKLTSIVINRKQSLPWHPIFGPWTSSMVDVHFLKLLAFVPAIFVITSMLEALWSPHELVRYILFSCGISGFVVLVGEYSVRIISGGRPPEIPLSGCAGLMLTLVIGFRHAFPYKEVINLNKYFPHALHDFLPARGLVQSRHIPFLCLLSEIVFRVISPAYFPEWSLAVTAFFASWFYIRYLMNFPYANVRGDHSSEFNISLLFPKFIRPWVDKVSELVYPIACRVSGGLLELRHTEKVSLAIASSLYSPSDSAAASAVIDGFAETSQEEKAKFEERRIKALKFLDANIAALMGGSEDGANDRLVENQRELGHVISQEELALV